MPYSARKLITKAWYLSGIVARNAQTVSGDQITDGLDLLNALLDWKSVDTALIPYWIHDTTNFTIAGKEEYFIQNCLAIESLTFNLDNIRYAMGYVSRRPYFGSGRVNNINSLPFNWTFNREKGGGKLYLYFIPQQRYQLNIIGKYGLQEVSLDEDLSLVYDASYIEYLRYALAQYMCSEYGILFNPGSLQILKQIERQLMYVSPPDLSMSKQSCLSSAGGLNWGDVWVGQGFRPG